MLFVWLTRLYTFISIDLQQSEGYLPWVHFLLVLISLSIGVYLTYLGVKARRSNRGDE
jgi:threonine/homoserine/homoserine lactone efflux protein